VKCIEFTEDFYTVCAKEVNEIFTKEKSCINSIIYITIDEF